MSTVALEIIWVLKVLIELRDNYNIKIQMFCVAQQFELLKIMSFMKGKSIFKSIYIFYRKRLQEVFSIPAKLRYKKMLQIFLLSVCL